MRTAPRRWQRSAGLTTGALWVACMSFIPAAADEPAEAADDEARALRSVLVIRKDTAVSEIADPARRAAARTDPQRGSTPRVTARIAPQARPRAVAERAREPSREHRPRFAPPPGPTLRITSSTDIDPPTEPPTLLRPEQAPVAAAPATPTPAGLAEGTHVEPNLDTDLDVDEPRVEIATFKGIRPGESTTDDVLTAWGKPLASETDGPRTRIIYSAPPFRQVEIEVIEQVVDSIRVQLSRQFDPALLARHLGLDNVRTVNVISNEGIPLGGAFPERGVLFKFSRDARPPRVSQVLLEVVTAGPFLLRASDRLHGPYALNMGDLQYALKLEPNNVEALQRKARVLLAVGRTEAAARTAARSVELDPSHGRARITWSRCLASLGKYGEARQEVQTVLDQKGLAPLDRARAQLQLGNLLFAATRRNTRGALRLHLEAIDTAAPLVKEGPPAITSEARELLVDAHLAVALDIGWGNWKHQAEVVPRWVERASLLAEQAIEVDPASVELRLRVAERALAARSGFRSEGDPTLRIEDARRAAKAALQQFDDPFWHERINWQLAVASLSAVEIEHSRGAAKTGLGYGDAVRKLLDGASPERLAGQEGRATEDRLHFALGALYAVHRNDHAAAVEWYDRIDTERDSLGAPFSRGRRGEALVSMGVSYWELSQRDKALSLTEAGLSLVRKAVEKSALPEVALAVPYGNLARMHKHLGQEEKASSYLELAAKAAELRRK